MKRLHAIVVALLLLGAASAIYTFSDEDSGSSNADASPSFIYKVDGYNIYVDARSTDNDKLTYVWDWGDGNSDTSAEGTALCSYTYYHAVDDFDVTLTVLGDGMNLSCYVPISVPAYRIGVCPEDADIPVSADSFRTQYIYDIHNIGGRLDYLDTPLTEELPNKWAIMATCCNTGNTAWGVQSDYHPGIQTLKEIGYPEEHFIYLENFTYNHECLEMALSYIKEVSPDFSEATVVLYFVTHGACTATNSYMQIYEHGTDNLQTTEIWDHELRDMLQDFTPAQFLFITVACQSGFMANEDTSGTLYGSTADGYENPSMPGRMIVTGSTTPLLTWSEVLGTAFWVEAIGENKGDSAPTGNGDGRTSVEEAFFYCKTIANEQTNTATSQPCMDDRYPAGNPATGEMFL